MRMKRLVLGAIVAMSASCFLPTAAGAQHQNGGVSIDWQFPYATPTLTQEFSLAAVSDRTRWGMELRHAGSGMVSQLSIEKGLVDNHDWAVFSMPSIAYVHPSSGVTCLQKADGQTCLARLTIAAGGRYTMEVFHLDDGNPFGSWIARIGVVGLERFEYVEFGAMVPSAPIGDIHASTTYATYVGPTVPCDSVPPSRAHFDAPFMLLSRTERASAGPSHVESCSGGEVYVPAHRSSAGLELGLRGRPTDPAPPSPSPPSPLPRPPSDRVAPRISGLAVSPDRFRAARGARVRYTLSEPARVSFAIERQVSGRRVGGRCVKRTTRNRRRQRCRRWVRLGRGGFVAAGRAGINAVRFTPRLQPGRYRLVTTSVIDGAGQVGSNGRAEFRVERPARP
jgi:hypothetical protein